MTNNELKNKLQAIIDNTSGDTLETEVAKEALKNENISMFFNALATEGPKTGWVPSLVFVADSYAFYDKHYEEIEDLRLEFEDMGSPFKVGDDLKNDYAWFAFMVTAGRMAEELGIE